MTTTMKTDAKASSQTGSKTGTRKAAAPKSKGAKPRPSKASTAKSGSPKANASVRSTKPDKVTKSTIAKTPKPKPSKPVLKKQSGLDLAAKVLAEAGRPLSAKEIAERVIAAGWTTTGKTPHATLYSAMLREIKGKGAESRFHRHGRGQFSTAAKVQTGSLSTDQ